MGIVASFASDAGEDTSSGASFAVVSGLPAAVPNDLVPDLKLAPGIVFGLAGLPTDAVSRQASRETGGPEDLVPMPDDEIEPRADLKSKGRAFPTVDRSHKSDPFTGLRPGFESRLRRPGGIAAARFDALLMSRDGNFAFDGFTPSDGKVPGPDSVDSFELSSDDDTATTGPAIAGASPGRSSSVPTLRRSAPDHSVFDGATPSVPRAVALASATPTPADATPVEVVAVAGIPQVSPPPKSIPNATVVARTDRPDYASLIDQDKAHSQERCLAEAIYFEARSEPEKGQAAVAQVVLNRVRSGLYPATVCGVVFQNRNRHDACQFSFACDGRALRVTEPEAWRTAVRIARNVIDGATYVAGIGDATHYHANYVRPRWARYLEKTDVIGHHIFYQLRPGQS
jgi:hypothetical protein